MDPKAWPEIPAALMDHLDKLVPERSPQTGESLEDLHRRGGQRDLVRVLLRVFEEQNLTLLTPQDPAHVSSPEPIFGSARDDG